MRPPNGCVCTPVLAVASLTKHEGGHTSAASSSLASLSAGNRSRTRHLPLPTYTSVNATTCKHVSETDEHALPSVDLILYLNSQEAHWQQASQVTFHQVADWLRPGHRQIASSTASMWAPKMAKIQAPRTTCT